MKMHRSRISWPSPMLSRGLSQRQKKKNHYDSLEVDSKATQNEIKSAYFKLTMQYHPDKNPSDAAKVKFRNIAEAYEVLGNYDKRRQYDRGMQIKSDDRKKQEVHRPQDFSKEAQRVRTAIYRQSTDTTGTSRMYDFDEWTKAHYGNTFRRTMYVKKDLKEIVEEREYFRAAEKNSTTEVTILAAVMCTIALFVGLVTNDNTMDNPNFGTGDKEGKGT